MIVFIWIRSRFRYSTIESISSHRGERVRHQRFKLLSLLALAELVADKLPKTPKRTNLGPLVSRAITGGFCSIAICTSAHQSPVIGTILGVLGSIAGAFAGYEIRHRLGEAFGLSDFGVAVAEDLVAIGGGLLIVSHMF